MSHSKPELQWTREGGCNHQVMNYSVFQPSYQSNGPCTERQNGRQSVNLLALLMECISKDLQYRRDIPNAV